MHTARADTLLLADSFNTTVTTGGSSMTYLAAGSPGSMPRANMSSVTISGWTGTTTPSGLLELAVDPNGVRGDALFGHNFNGADSAGGLNINLRCQPTTTGVPIGPA